MTESEKGPRTRTIPDGDDRERLTCPDCGYIAYDNPKVVVGAVPVRDDKILLCKRAIEPRKGFWTIPAGYLENGETTDEGAAREAWEEAQAALEIGDLIAIYNLPHIAQIQIFYRARLKDDKFAPGDESEDVRLFAWQDIPWPDLAFPTVHKVLKAYRKSQCLAQVVPQQETVTGGPEPDPETVKIER